MFGTFKGMWRLVVTVVAVALGTSELTIVPAGLASAEGEAETAAAERLAHDHNVSLAEATARIGRQDRTLSLAQEAERNAGRPVRGGVDRPPRRS